MQDGTLTYPPFAPPFLKDGPVLVAQTSLILQYLAPTLKLVARSEQARVWTQQIQITIADMVAEAHDTHHPVGAGLYYENQKFEALRRVKEFCSARMPKYLQWFERIIVCNPAGPRNLVGSKLSAAVWLAEDVLRRSVPLPGNLRLHG